MRAKVHWYDATSQNRILTLAEMSVYIINCLHAIATSILVGVKILMSQQQEHAPQQKKPPTAKEILQSSVADASRVIENTETVTGTPRLIANGGLLGVCIVFLAAMLSISKLDTPLTIALCVFSFAIPILSFSFLSGLYKSRPVPGHLVLQALLTGSWIVGSIGQLCAAIGIFFVILHLSNIASIAFVAAIIFVIALIPVFSFVGLMIYAIIQYRKEQRAKQAVPKPEPEADKK